MSKMLTYIGVEYKNDCWINATEYFDECATSIEKISNIIIEYVSEKNDNTDLLPDLFFDVCKKMKEAFTILYALE